MKLKDSRFFRLFSSKKNLIPIKAKRFFPAKKSSTWNKMTILTFSMVYNPWGWGCFFCVFNSLPEVLNTQFRDSP